MRPEIARLRFIFCGIGRKIGREIADTFSPRGGFIGRPFHLRFSSFAGAQSLTGILPLSLFIVHGPEEFRLYALAFLGFKITVGALISALIITRYYPVWIGENGLRARNFWGLARRLEWNEIERVRPIRWLIVTPVLRISGSKLRDSIWLPLFLDKQQEFAQVVRETVPRGNPLREYFEG